MTEALPHAVQLRDGRIAWPSVVQYRVRLPDGSTMARLPAPPRDGSPYTVVIHDLAAYDALSRAGRLHLPAHTGAVADLVDERKAPQA